MADKGICAVEGCGKPILHRQWCSPHYHRWRSHGDPTAGGVYAGEITTFIKAALASETDDCIVWPFARHTGGYGNAWIDGSHQTVHTYVCTHTHGPKPKGMEAAHDCGNAPCINPRHIQWKTPAGNQADRIRHGTSNRGGRYRNSKLKEADVRTIRARAEAGEPHDVIAADYPVSRTVITRVANRTRWGWLE